MSVFSGLFTKQFLIRFLLILLVLILSLSLYLYTRIESRYLTLKELGLCLLASFVLAFSWVYMSSKLVESTDIDESPEDIDVDPDTEIEQDDTFFE